MESTNLNFTYEEHAKIKLDNLRAILMDEEKTRLTNLDKWQRYRIYRNNFYEEVSIRTQNRCLKLLRNTLNCLGHHLYRNLGAMIRENGSIISSPSLPSEFSQQSSIFPSHFVNPDPKQRNSILVVDRGNKLNYVYDENGVMHLRSKKNIKFSAIKKRQALMLAIIAKASRLIGTDCYMTQREMYYTLQDFCKTRKITQNSTQTQSQTQNSSGTSSQQFNTQANEIRPQYNSSHLDTALNDICCLIGCSRIHLHVVPQSKGLIFGNMKLCLKGGDVIDCLSKKQGTSLPDSRVPIIRIETNANFVLILEKDSVLQRIINQEDKSHFLSKFKAILVTGKGYPDLNTRAFVNFLWNKLNIPILALTDADPHGLEIVCCYKFGSYKSSYEGPNLVTPQVRWLGILPSDVLNLNVSDTNTRPQFSHDLKKINSLLKRPYIKTRPDWTNELMLMRSNGRKAEIECLDETFLVNTYLPNKLKYASWL